MYMYLGYSLKSYHVSRPINSDKARESTAASNQKSLKYYYSFCYSTVHIKSTTGNQSCSAISLQSSSIMFFFHFHIHFFAIASPYQSTLLAQDVKLMHQANTKEAKSTVMHPSQRVLYIWCARLQVVVVVVQSSFVVKKKGLVVMSDVRSRHE